MIITRFYDVSFDEEKNVYRIKSFQAPLRPNCSSLLSGYDSRSRFVIGFDGKKYKFLLRRLRCPSCKKLHLEIPDLIDPNFHYAAEVRRQAFDHLSMCPEDDSTIRRWRKGK